MARFGWARWLVAVLFALGVVAGAVLLATSLELHGSYRPPGSGADPSVSADVSSTQEQIDREDSAAAALSVLSAVALVASGALLAVRRHWAWGVAVVAALAGTAGAAASIATATTVRWDQLALTTVSTGSGLTGYDAGTSPLVASVLTDGQELTTTELGRALTVHMVGPVLALVGLVVGLVVVVLWGGGQLVWRRTKAASSSTASTASGNAG
jgi:hypothetical protein